MVAGICDSWGELRIFDLFYKIIGVFGRAGDSIESFFLRAGGIESAEITHINGELIFRKRLFGFSIYDSGGYDNIGEIGVIESTGGGVWRVGVFMYGSVFG